MIFVATGLHEHGFDRLVRAADHLVRDNQIADVFIQTGYSEYKPSYAAWKQAIDFTEFQDHLQRADIVVTHGGAGCIADAIELKKRIVVVPRLKRFNEHSNDHQLELAKALEESGRVLVAYDIEDLLPLIHKASEFRPTPSSGKSEVSALIGTFLKEVASSSGLTLGETGKGSRPQ